ncbi:MAG: sigma-70 family RNA polymerase sigma factor [Chloroflexia bacterium]
MIEHLEYRQWRDNELAFAARNGDYAARNALYLRHRPLISRRIIPAKRLARLLQSRGAPITAEDVEQEAFVVFCRLLDEWQPEHTRFIPFLAQTIPGALYEYVRTLQHLRSSRAQLIGITPGESLDLGPNPRWGAVDRPPEDADPASRGELPGVARPADEPILEAEKWTRLVGHLREDWARLLHLRFWEDKSSRQIAQSEGCTQRTVNRAVQSALASIQDLMQEDWDAL